LKDDVPAVSRSSKYDLIEAAGRQMAFLYQVSLPHYRDQCFLEAAVERYLDKFLELKRRRPQEFWVPTYDIDIIWHAHMLNPVPYFLETNSLCGLFLPHDDSVNDRSAGSDLLTRWEATQKAWQECFADGGPTVGGGNFRGTVTLEERKYHANQWNWLRSVVGPDVNIRVGSSQQLTKVALSQPWPETSTDRQETRWVHRKDLQDGASGLRRFSKFGSLHGQVVHGRNKDKAFSFVEVMKDPGLLLPLVTAHTIGFDQLPAEEQVSYDPTCAYLKHQEMAYLFRVASEDVAVIIGSWRGFRRPVKGKRGVPGDLAIRIFALKTNSQVDVGTFQRKNRPARFTISLSSLGLERCRDTVDIDLAEAKVSGCTNTTDMAIAYGLSLTLATLHVALQPRQQPRGGMAPGPGNEASLYPRWTVQQQDFPLLIAAGGEIKAAAGPVYGRALRRPSQGLTTSLDDSCLIWGGGQIYSVDHGYEAGYVPVHAHSSHDHAFHDASAHDGHGGDGGGCGGCGGCGACGG